ncbi:MAG TPA: Gfo/Idh/MocA family oxidoreductase [Pirellulales bacterium]|jgi:predicted dehydrogenase|nr:Gfo/Idh/MocA family oxidoreductase [Pirellulales bacterium]
MSEDSLSRRTFIRSTAGGVAASCAVAQTLAAPQPRAANERLRIGFIGPGRRGFAAHVKPMVELRKLDQPIDLVAVCDVYSVHRDRAANFIQSETGTAPKTYVDYREMLADAKLDGVCIGTPDHWHAKQSIDALAAGVNVYCEKPMTHTLEQAKDVVQAWKKSGLVMQVGVQSTSSPIWDKAREMIDAGRLGKVVQFQTEWFRNSRYGMSRHNEITAEMTPDTIDWKRWLGVDEGLAPMMPFDRATYGQWRCYWPFSCGMLGDLFVHRVTGMLKATGLRYPGRVVGGGGIFMEYDDRQVPDVATVIADFHEGVQGVVCSTMVSEERRNETLIRGHSGLIVFDNFPSGPKAAFEFIPERAQVTGDRNAKKERVEATTPYNFDMTHQANFLDAIRAGKPSAVNNDPELGAAAVMMVTLAVECYRQGKVFQIDKGGNVSGGDTSWAKGWEKMSKAHATPHHVPGWTAGDTGSKFFPPAYQKLAGPWIDGKPPKHG